MHYQLSLDTCTKACSVALTPLGDGQQSYMWFEILDRGHAEILAAKAQMLMQQANVNANQISQIAVTVGPGTFTGARIALSFARMFASARKIPIIALNSLEAIAYNAKSLADISPKNSLYIAMDARRGQVYFAAYNILGSEIIAPKAMDINEAASLLQTNSLILGTGRNLVIEAKQSFEETYTLPENIHFPNAGTFGEKVKHKPTSYEKISPLYLRAADAKLPQSHPISFTQ